MKRRDFLAKSAATIAASGCTNGIAWALVPTDPDCRVAPENACAVEFEGEIRLDPGVVGSRRYNAFTEFDPYNRQITLHYNLLPHTNPDRAWDGRTISFRYDGPDGIFDIMTDVGHVAYLVVTTNPNQMHNPNLVIMPDYTLHAYNRMGGGSLYTGPDWITMDRPAVLPWYSAPAFHPLYFMDRHDLSWDLIKQSDLDFMPGAYDLSVYQRLVIYGHDEYWTQNIRARISAAVESGVDLVNLSGNTCYWGVTLDGRKINRNLLGHFDDSPSLTPEWELLGNAFLWGGYPIKRQWFRYQSKEMLARLQDIGFPFDHLDNEDRLKEASNVRVIDSDAAPLAGTGLIDGDWISDSSDVLGVEIDGLPLTPIGDVDLDKTRGFEPDELEIGCEGWAIGDRPNHFGFNLKSRYKNGGYVWSNSSITWIKTLLNDNPVTTKITLNAFRD